MFPPRAPFLEISGGGPWGDHGFPHAKTRGSPAQGGRGAVRSGGAGLSDRISWLSVPDEEHVSEEIKSEIWEPVREKVGFVPNVARIFAVRPSHLLGWWRYYDDLLRGDSGLTRAEREMIAVVVSVANDCHY
jgi:hypothetical protein